MKKLMKFFGIVAVAAMSLTACQNEFDEQVNVNGGETVVVDITANAPATRSAFGDKDGNAYPSTWSGNELVGFIANPGSEVTNEDITKVPNKSVGKTAKFTGVELANVGTSGYILAVSPYNTGDYELGGFSGISGSYNNFYISIPKEQKPLAKSVDESAHLLFAKYEYNSTPANVVMNFQHIGAYGKMTINNFDGEIAGITLTATQNIVGRGYCTYDGTVSFNNNYASATLTLNTSNTEVWFACHPVGTLTGNLTIVITDKEGVTYTKELATAGRLAFNAGQVSAFSVDMAGIEADEEVDLSKGAWVLVDDVADLAVNDNILIVAADYNNAMSTEQKSNNRGQVAIEKQENLIADITDAVQVITLEKGSVDNTFAFKVTDGYLYAANSSSNHLKTQAQIDANASWAITISNNVASIIAKGSNTRNVMQYNQASSLFACYSSASQNAISIYKHDANVVVLHRLDAPVVSTTIEDLNTITVEWEEVLNAVSYKVTCGDEIKETTDTSVSFTDLEYSTTYNISVVAIADGVNYKDSNASTAKATTGSNPNASTKTYEVTIDNVFGTTGTMNGTTSISWTSGDITLTNTKNSNSSAIRNSDSDHYRVYQNSTLTVSTIAGNITTIVITCTTSAYANVMNTSFTNAGFAATVSGSVVTVTGSASAYTMTASAQTRISKVVVTYEK